MCRRFLLAAVLSIVLATMPVSPALTQLSGDGPPPPKYQVNEDGSLVIEGDIVVSCHQIGQEDPYLQADGPEAQACEAAGFGTAAGPSPGDTSARPRRLPRFPERAVPAVTWPRSFRWPWWWAVSWPSGSCAETPETPSGTKFQG